MMIKVAKWSVITFFLKMLPFLENMIQFELFEVRH